MSDQIEVPLIPDCASCIVSSLKTLIPLLSTDFKVQAEYFALAFKALSEGYAKNTAPVLLTIAIYRDLYTRAGLHDPYAEIKHLSKDAALRALPLIERKMEGLHGRDLFRACLSAAVTGNVIDFNTAGHEPDLEKLTEMFEHISSTGFAVDDSEFLWNTLEDKRGRLTFLADNAGEVILDIPLLRFIRGLGWKIIFVVKEQPIINDATIDDVRGTEIEELADIVDNGAWAHGVPLRFVSDEFLQLVANSDLVISKGQANIETFPEIQKQTNIETYYITRAKCPHISQAVGAKKGENVVYRQPRPDS
jgi:uncharacterized protein with ATP-grasp and redox domains